MYAIINFSIWGNYGMKKIHESKNSKKFNSTIMIVTHELDSIFTVADRAIFLDSKGGGILAEGTPAELRDSCKNPFVRNFLNRGKV